jgi:hypothetical protein
MNPAFIFSTTRPFFDTKALFYAANCQIGAKSLGHAYCKALQTQTEIDRLIERR